MEDLLKEWGFEHYVNVFKGNIILDTYLQLCLIHYFYFGVSVILKWCNATCVVVK
jgi:hypothetical protein